MPNNGLIDKARIEIKLGDYGVGPATALSDPTLHPRVQDYRRQTGSRMYPLDRSDVRQKIPTAEYHVSRKVDGEFTALIYREGQAFALNPGGTVRVGLPWIEEAAQLLSRADVSEAIVAGEFYVARSDEQRSRVHDVTRAARQPESQDDLQRLQFAVFDLISLNGEPPPEMFADTWATIQRLFGDGQKVHPVDSASAKDAEGVDKLFQQWVEEDGAEGLVVRSDTAGLFKVKPRHTLDAVVVGFTESTDERQGLLHDLLLGIIRRDGTVQVLSRVGGGFSDDQRREMLSDLKDMVVESEYAEVSADHVAYQMVQPEWVVEISCLDLISQTTRGGPVNRMVLDAHGNGSPGYRVVRRMPLAAVISPQFVRRREDKSVTRQDVRIEQLTDIVEISHADRDVREMTLPKSQILRREVYTKQLRGETMVRKFLMWKTNKETESADFPAYVLHYTDFSPNRKTPLAREVRVSSSLDQIHALWDGLKQANIKKGWDLHSAAVGDTALAAPTDTASVAPEVGQPAGAEKTASPKPAKKAAKAKTAAKRKTAKLAPSERSASKARKTPKKKTG
jgi:hypothetical protein